MGFIHQIDLVRLDRWARGDGTTEELEVLRRWIDSDPDLQALAAAMRSVGQPSLAADRPWDTQGRWARLQRQIRSREEPALAPLVETGAHGGETRERRWSWRAIAAAAAIASLGVGASLWSTWVAQAARQKITDSAAAMREIATRRGERLALALPDGSRVVLAPDSRLRIPISYRTATGARDVYLDRGDAFFVVEHHASRPFQVHTAGGVAEDLGTEFLVTAQPDKVAMRVVVVSGEVAVRSTRKDMSGRALFTLGAGQLGELDSVGTVAVRSNVRVERYIAWIEGTLMFDNAPLDEVIATLSRWYDLDISLTDSALAARRVTVTIRNQPASGVLESIAVSLGLQVERRGARVTLAPRP